MNSISKNNKYFDSDGNKYTQGQINSRTTNAKALKIEDMQTEHGYIFCEDCKINSSSGVYIDCSHTISVMWAKNNRQVELCWDWEGNIKMRCRPCHRAHDKTL